MSNCFGCGKGYRAETPIWKCECGYLNRKRRNKYLIDFTIKKHGEFIMWASTEEEAMGQFKNWIKSNRKETEIFMEHLTFDTEIESNFIYQEK